ncbi:MAG TPA: S24/S26 family peptidase [Abditibacteriaceae bacterium]
MTAASQLICGETIEIKPQGGSMTGRINNGDTVTLSPCNVSELKTDDIVLVRIRGRRFQHIVLHQILQCDGKRFLIGSFQGRVDGWVQANDIFGKAIEIKPN